MTPRHLMPTISRRPFRIRAAALALAGASLSGLAPAEPMSSDVTGAAAPADQATVPVGPGAAREPIGAAGIRQSATVELLLQLQDRPAATATGTATNANSVHKAREARAAAAAASMANAEQAQEQHTLKAIALSPAGLVPGAMPDSNAARSDYGRRGVPAPGTDDPIVLLPERGLLHHPLVGLIREHRVLTIVLCLGLLVAMWLTANFTFRRRR